VIRNLLLTFSIFVLSLAAGAQALEPIRIGTTQSLTGQYQDFGTEQLRGLQMWVGDINSRGALLGRPVELVYYDDGSDANNSVKLYKKLIEQDKVDLLVGPYSSDLTLAASSVAEEHNMLMLTTAASAEGIWSRGYRNVIGIDVPTGDYLSALASGPASSQGATTVALIYVNTEFGNEVAIGARRQAAAVDLRIVLDESYDENQRDFSALAQRLREAKPDVILGISYLNDSVALVRALKKAGVKPKMLAFTVGPALHEFGDQLGADAEGVVGIVQWLRSVRLSGAQDFAYRYRRTYGNNPAVHAAIGYSAGQVIESAVRLAGTTEHDAVREQLLTMQFNSLLGQYNVNETGRQIGKKNYLLQWQDGRRRLVEPKTLAESKLIYPMP
jgi:branched-chain amino acid transport system substrate-binding protein